MFCRALDQEVIPNVFYFVFFVLFFFIVVFASCSTKKIVTWKERHRGHSVDLEKDECNVG